MRTTAELSKLTGVPKRTLQYWSQERKQNAKGQEVGGAGILPSRVNPENGYRVFSDDALARVLLIMLAKEAGCGQSEIRDYVASLESSVPLGMRSHIERMEADCKELERKICLAKAMEAASPFLAAGDACRPEDSARSPITSELIAMATMEFLESLSRNAPDVSPDSLSDAVKEWLAQGGYGAMLLELLAGMGAVDAAIEVAASFGGRDSE